MLNLDNTVADLVNASLSNKQTWELIRANNEEFSINAVPFIYTAAGFITVDARKKLFETNEHTNYKLTIRDALPLARALRNEQKKQQAAVNATKSKEKSVYTAVLDADNKIDSNELKTLNPTENNVQLPFSPTDPTSTDSNELKTLNLPTIEQLQPLILQALGLDSIQLNKLQALLNDGLPYEQSDDSSTTIYNAVKKLSARNRKNKTYYISEELIEHINLFADAYTIKPSAFVEVAIIDALKRYSKE